PCPSAGPDGRISPARPHPWRGRGWHWRGGECLLGPAEPSWNPWCLLRRGAIRRSGYRFGVRSRDNQKPERAKRSGELGLSEGAWDPSRPLGAALAPSLWTTPAPGKSPLWNLVASALTLIPDGA